MNGSVLFGIFPDLRLSELRDVFPDRREFYKYLGWVIVPALLTGWMMYSVWVSGGREIVRSFANSIVIVPQGPAGVEAIAVFGLGLYLTYLFLFTNDFRKRYQGVLLWIVTGIVLAVLWNFEVFLPNIDPTVTNGFWFIVGMILALASETVDLSKIYPGLKGELTNVSLYKSRPGMARTEGGGLAEFPIASRALLVIITVVVSASALMAVLIGSRIELLVLWLSGGAGLLWSMNQFVSLSFKPEDDQIEILGPEKSGKTTVIFGLHKTAKEMVPADAHMTEGEFDLNENQGMQDLVQLHAEWDGDGWPWRGNLNDELDEISFEYTSGRRFLSKTRISMWDHPGECLLKLPKELGFEGERRGFDPEADPTVGTVLPDGGTSKDGSEGHDGEDDEADDDKPVLDMEQASEDTEPSDSPSESSITPGESSADGSVFDFTGDSQNPDNSTEPDSVQDDSDEESSDDDTEAVDGPQDRPTGSSLAGDESQDDTADTDTESSVSESSEDGLADDAYRQNGTTTGGDPSASTSEDSGSGSSDTTEDEPGPGSGLTTETADFMGGSSAEAGAGLGTGTTESESAGPADPESDDIQEDTGATEPASQATPSSQSSDNSRGIDSSVEELAHRVKDADKLLMLIDSERIIGHDPTGTDSEERRRPKIAEYNRLLESEEVDVDDVFLIVSKADVFLGGWRERKKPEVGDDPGESAEAMESFTDHVSDQLNEYSGPLDQLKAKATNQMIYPVFVEVNEKTEKFEVSEEYSDEGDSDDESTSAGSSSSGENLVVKEQQNAILEPTGFQRVLNLISD